MKKLWFIGIVSLIIGLGGIGCGFSGYRVVTGFINNKLNLEPWTLNLFKWCFNGLPLVDKIDKLLDNKNYIVVFQNNNELRASGGFMGSYAAVNVQRSGIRDIKIQDIYVPDGQLVGHVDPPAPIQQAFGQGWWKLRDSNWDPDFNIAGEQIAWFFEQGGERADGLIAVNLSLVNSLLGALGEIKTTDYPEKITDKTFYNLAQKYAEEKAFPGSTQKGDFLGAVGKGMIERTKSLKLLEIFKLFKLAYGEFKKGEILVWFKDKDLQRIIRQQKYGGGDYLYIVESNLGANKANCCMNRQVIQEIDNFKTRLVIKYQNDNPFANPKSPYFWGGNYIDYLRIIIPKAAQIESVMVGNKQLIEKQLDIQYGLQEDRYLVEDKNGFKTVGFWAVVPAGGTNTVEISYTSPLPLSLLQEREILVRHQPGIAGFPYKLVVNGKVIMDKNIDRDTVIPLD